MNFTRNECATMKEINDVNEFELYCDCIGCKAFRISNIEDASDYKKQFAGYVDNSSGYRVIKTKDLCDYLRKMWAKIKVEIDTETKVRQYMIWCIDLISLNSAVISCEDLITTYRRLQKQVNALKGIMEDDS